MLWWGPWPRKWFGRALVKLDLLRFLAVCRRDALAVMPNFWAGEPSRHLTRNSAPPMEVLANGHFPSGPTSASIILAEEPGRPAKRGCLQPRRQEAMNIAMTEPKAAVSPSLKGKVSLDHRLDQRHRSRHRPGARRRRLGRSAERLRQAGGDRSCTRRRRQGLRRSRRLFPRRHVKPRLDRRDDRNDSAQIRPARRARQQCRHPARGAVAGLPAGEVGRDPRHQSVLRLPHHAARAALDDRQQMGAHHQHRLGARARRLRLQISLCGGEARHSRAHQGDRARSRGSTASPATPSAPAMSTRRWSKRRSKARRSRMASRASR